MFNFVFDGFVKSDMSLSQFELNVKVHFHVNDYFPVNIGSLQRNHYLLFNKTQKGLHQVNAFDHFKTEIIVTSKA